jgi:hypothetical protein
MKSRYVAVQIIATGFAGLFEYGLSVKWLELLKLPTRLVGSMDRHGVFLVRKFPCPWASLPPQPVPEGSQRVSMGPRNQARRLPPDGPKGRQSGQAIHPSRL